MDVRGDGHHPDAGEAGGIDDLRVDAVPDVLQQRGSEEEADRDGAGVLGGEVVPAARVGRHQVLPARGGGRSPAG
jgi:hypothetical protein